MMKITHRSPSTIWLPSDDEAVKKFLTYKDKQVQYLISRLKKSYKWAYNCPEYLQTKLDQLNQQINQCLIKYDNDQPYTYSGLAYMLSQKFGWTYEKPSYTLSNKLIPWHKTPPTCRPYQEEAIVALENAGHGAISLPTGSGKSLCLIYLVKRNPVQTVIVTPFRAITTQLYKDFVNFFGAKHVGQYGDGKKDYKKLITIATAQSLSNLSPDDEAYRVLSQCKVMMFDESHMCVPDTMEHVCMGILGLAERRYFVSATQTRTDGSELLLKGIIGPIVYNKPFNELVEEKYLKKPIFKIFSVPAYGSYSAQDAKQETRKQLYQNPNVNKIVGKIVSIAYRKGRQTVIIIEEFRQFLSLLNFLTVPFEFVHGGISQDAKEFIPKEYWESDIEGAIERFNSGKTKVLIGTSAISTGVDLRPVGCLIYLQGGISEIKIKQAIGRGTRMVPEIDNFWVIDFMVKNSPVLERHCKIRMDLYHDMGQVEVFES